MKKIIAILLCLCTLFPMLAACNETEPTPTTTPTAGTTASTKETVEAEGIKPAVSAGTYEFKHTATGTVITSNNSGMIGKDEKNKVVSVDWTLWQGKISYRLGLFGMRIADKSGVSVYNYEVEKNLSSKGKTVLSADNNIGVVANLWSISQNDDGTYYVKSRVSDKLYLTCDNGELKLESVQPGDDASAHKWTITDKSLDNPYYKEYKSDNGYVTVRLHLDVFNEDLYEPIKVKGQPNKKYVPTEETIVEYANAIEKIKDEYTDLCGFEPYNIIMVHAYNYNKSMACVWNDLNNNFVWINSEIIKNDKGEITDRAWFYWDLAELQFRKEALKLADCGWVQLHEIGHMYDLHRGWNFESEMTADLKAAYFLAKHPEYVAAPSEFQPVDYIHADDLVSGIDKLGGGKMRPNNADTLEEQKKAYSIYRNAAINTSFFEDHGISWDVLKETFYWFNQDPEGKKWKSDCTLERMAKFYEKLSEFSGKDVVSLYDPVEYEVVVTRMTCKNHEDHIADKEESGK